MAGQPILKQFKDLAAGDFATYPIWVPCRPGDSNQPWYGATDDDTYRPWLDALPIGRGVPIFLARTSLTLNDGTVFDGFATRPADGVTFDLASARPQLFASAGQRFGFWFGNASPSTSAKSDLYTAMGKSADSVFPIVNAVSNGISTVDLTLRIPGFCHFDPTPPPGPVVET